jgi:hypothetical protein
MKNAETAGFQDDKGYHIEGYWYTWRTAVDRWSIDEVNLCCRGSVGDFNRHRSTAVDYVWTTGHNFKPYVLLLLFQVPPLKLLTGPSPVKDLKAYKNSAEAKGMRNSQIKDALVWVRLVHRIEKGVREILDHKQGRQN